MPINELHRRVATVALRVGIRYGFALGGGNALIAHGLITKPTQDVDCSRAPAAARADVSDGDVGADGMARTLERLDAACTRTPSG